MPASLHIVDGPDAGRLFTLTDQVTIGRNADNTIVLNDTAVSGTHTKVVKNERGGFTVLDQQSTNGTFLNGRELRASDLKSGDKISIGSTTLAFEVTESAGIREGGRGAGAVPVPEAAGPRLILPQMELTAMSREELERAFRRSLLLDRLDRTLETLDGPGEILEWVLDAAIAASLAQRGVILLHDPRTGEIVPSSARSLLGDEVPFSKSLAIEVATQNQGYVGVDPGDPAKRRHVLCAPLHASSGTGGVILLGLPTGGAFGPHDLRTVETIARRGGHALSAVRWRVDFEQLFSSTVDAIMNTIQAKDVYTRGHSERVRHYSKLLGKELGLQGDELYRITLGAALHDIGKVGMPDSVLKHNKSPRLTPEQMEEVRKHPVRGAKILKDIAFMHDVIPAAELHHEDWDGSGYPYGMKGDEIPLSARIVAVADTYDAITTDRPYQKGKSYEDGHEILRKISGKRLEPELVEAFVSAWYRYRKGPVRKRRSGGDTVKAPSRTQEVVAEPASVAGEPSPSEQTVALGTKAPKAPPPTKVASRIPLDGQAATPAGDTPRTPAQRPEPPDPEVDETLSQIIQIG